VSGELSRISASKEQQIRCRRVSESSVSAARTGKNSKTTSSRAITQLDGPHVLGLKAFRAFNHVELDCLAFLK